MAKQSKRSSKLGLPVGVANILWPGLSAVGPEAEKAMRQRLAKDGKKPLKMSDDAARGHLSPLTHAERVNAALLKKSPPKKGARK